MAPRAVACRVIGYSTNTKFGYHVITATNKVFTRQDVIVDENWISPQLQFVPLLDSDPTTPLQNSGIANHGIVQEVQTTNLINSKKPKPVIPDTTMTRGRSKQLTIENQLLEPTILSTTEPDVVANNASTITLSTFGLQLLSPKEPTQVISHSITDLPPAPRSFKEAVDPNNKFHLHWKHAIDKEMNEMLDRNVFQPLAKGETGHAFPSMFVFRATRELDNTVKFKARLVALGNNQINHVHYERHSSPTLSLRSFNVILCIATIFKMQSEHIDIGNAYLEALAEDNLFMYLPKQYTNGKLISVKLTHNIYGMKQAGLLWYTLIDEVIKEFGFKRAIFDPCCYVYNDHENNNMFIGIFVDDIALFGNNLIILNKFKNHLQTKFKKVTFKGPLKVFLGIELNLVNNHIEISQTDTILSYCQENKVDISKRAAIIPIPVSHNLKENLYGEESPIHKEIGQIGWILHSRPELGYARSLLGQFNLHPSKYSKKVINDVFSYAYHADIDHKLKLGGTDTIIEPFCYADASYVKGGDSKSQHGEAWFLTKDSGAIFSTSQKSKTVATSSTDSEINALYEATKVAIWLRGFLNDLQHFQIRPTTIYQDNIAVIKLMDNANSEKHSKHALEKINYIRQEIEKHTIILQRMPSTDMVADILTKPLAKESFTKFRDIMLNGHGNKLIEVVEETK
jgi:hypothetical protein